MSDEYVIKLPPAQRAKLVSAAYTNSFIKLGVYYYLRYKENPEETLRMFCHTTVPMIVMDKVYHYLVNDGVVIKKELLAQEVKEKLWEQAKATYRDITKEKAKILCNIIWCMNSLLEYLPEDGENMLWQEPEEVQQNLLNNSTNE